VQKTDLVEKNRAARRGGFDWREGEVTPAAAAAAAGMLPQISGEH